MELFEQIRREYEFGVGTIRAVARKLGVHRRLVREALLSAVPPENKQHARKLRKLAAVSPFIDRILTEDQQAPPKQRHTAHRIWRRLCAEVPGFNGSERSVRGYVHRRRQELGLFQREVFVPQSYAWGSEAQCDWYDAYAILGGERVKLHVFEMRSMARREAGRWPECFDRLWQALNQRHGKQDGTRQMIELLLSGPHEGWDRLRAAVEEALSLGCQDIAAVRHLLVAGRLKKPCAPMVDIGVLARYERPQPKLNNYDELLAKVQA